MYINLNNIYIQSTIYLTLFEYYMIYNVPTLYQPYFINTKPPFHQTIPLFINTILLTSPIHTYQYQNPHYQHHPPILLTPIPTYQ